MTTQQIENPAAKFFQAKVAFEIPMELQVDGTFTKEYPDELVSLLLDLFDDVEFEGESLCAPGLLIVDTHVNPNAKWVSATLTKINRAIESHRKARLAQ